MLLRRESKTTRHSKVIYRSVRTKGTVLNRYDSPDIWFWVHGSINPYRGCEHDCKYCDGRAEWYGIDQFGTFIRVKQDAPQRYEEDLLKLGYYPDYRPRAQTLERFFDSPLPLSTETRSRKIQPHRFPIAVGGGVCDVYQPAERKYKVTRRLLIKQRDFGLPTTVLTKSRLVLRDLAYFREINEISYASISFSITFCDETLRRRFEPFSASTRQRFNALQTVRDHQLHGGAMLMPLLPGLGDTEDNLRCLISKARDAKAEFVLPSGLTLKPGKNKQEFLHVIREHFPELVSLYQELYAKNNQYGISDKQSPRAFNVMALGHEICRKMGIPDRMPRYIPSSVPQVNYLVSTVLFSVSYYYRWIEEAPFDKFKPYSKAATQIEGYEGDIETIPIGRLRKQFHLSEEVLEVVEEVIETGASSLLSSYIPADKIFINPLQTLVLGGNNKATL